MKNLFERAAVFTDIHFGKRSDSEIHNKDCLEYIKWFCGNVVEQECDTIIFGGDWSDNRSRIRLDTNWYSREAISRLLELNKKIYWLVGNHDLYYRDSRKIHSLPFLDNYDKNLILVNEIQSIGNVLLCPWLVGGEYTSPPQYDTKYVFGHFEFPLFLMNEQVECRDKGGIHMDHFYQTEEVYSGHFHKRQTKLNENKIPVTYIGNCFAHDFNDVGDRERGCMILPWDGEPEYLNWVDGPNFLEIPLSGLIDLIESEQFYGFVNERCTIKCSDDLNIDLNETLEIKEIVQSHVRNIYIEPSEEAVTTDMETDMDAGENLSVDQMVVNHLENLDTEGSEYDNSLLVKLFVNSGEK